MVIFGSATPCDTKVLNLNGFETRQKPTTFLWLLRPTKSRCVNNIHPGGRRRDPAPRSSLTPSQAVWISGTRAKIAVWVCCVARFAANLG